MRITWLAHLRRMICLGIASVIIGLAALVLVFCIPVGAMGRHVGGTADRMLEDAVPADTWMGRLLKDRETYTDAIMVQNAIEKIDGKNVFEHAMWVYHLDLDENVWTPEASLRYLAGGGDKSVMHLQQYSRYWHGYLVYLKPLLLLFTWEQTIWLGAVLQICLLAAVLAAAVKTGVPRAGAAVVAGLIFMKPVLIHVSLAMGVCWVITLGALLFILLKDKKLEQRDAYPEFFCMIGILVAYFDFLTYPAVTLGFPLCVYFLKKEEDGPWKNVAEVISYSVCWGLGYVGMWSMKWVIADITLGTGTIKSALGSILGWTEAIGGRPRLSGALYTISLNLQKYESWLYPVLAALLLAAAAAAAIYAARKASPARALSCMPPYLLIACIPFAWYTVVQHHSGLHVWFTFRVVGVTAMALGAMGLKLFRLGRESCRNKLSQL